MGDDGRGIALFMRLSASLRFQSAWLWEADFGRLLPVCCPRRILDCLLPYPCGKRRGRSAPVSSSAHLGYRRKRLVESKDVVSVVARLDVGKALVVDVMVGACPVGEVRVGEARVDAARPVRMDD